MTPGADSLHRRPHRRADAFPRSRRRRGADPEFHPPRRRPKSTGPARSPGTCRRRRKRWQWSSSS